MPDNPPMVAPSPFYPKPQGRGTGPGGGGGGSREYSKPSHRGRTRGGGGMNSDRSQQGDNNRGTPDARGYQATHSQQTGIVGTGVGTSNSYNSNMYPSAGAVVNPGGNYIPANYNNHYRGRDSRSSWDGSSNSSKKGGSSYNQHNSPMVNNAAPSYPQSATTPSVPSITNAPVSSGTSFISPQYYTTVQTGYVNNGAKPDPSTTNLSQISTQPTSATVTSPNSGTGTPAPLVSASPPASSQLSVQIEKGQVPASVTSLNQSGTAAAATSAPQKTSASSSAGSNSNSINVHLQGHPTNSPSALSPSKPTTSSMLPVQALTVSNSAGNISQQPPVVVSTIAQPVVSQQSSNSPIGAHSTGSQRPSRGVSDDSNSGSGVGYHGHNAGYYQNYHPKSSVDLNKEGPPM